MSDFTLSSTALRAYWLGRYLERAGNMARLVSVNARWLIDLPQRVPHGWIALVQILSMEETFAELYGEELLITRHGSNNTEEKKVTRFLLSDQRHPGSLLSALLFAKENARALRGTLPRDAFEYVNEANLYAKEALSEPLSRTRRTNGLQHIQERLQQIDGFLSSAMLHNSVWQFVRLGNFVERADMMTRIIDLHAIDIELNAASLEPFEDLKWRTILASVDALQGYTSVVQAPISQPDVLEFLLKHPDVPRSFMRCLNSIRNCLRALPRNAEPLAHIDIMRRQLHRARVRSLAGPKLHRYMDVRQRQLQVLHNKITDTYFAQ